MILIYTHKITNRVKYIFKVIFNELFETEFLITTDKQAFISSENVKLSYSYHPLKDEVHITCHDLLFETNIEHKEIYVTKKDNLPIFFQTNDALGFDIFAASFYLITRYEEYLPFVSDVYYRFEAKDSLAQKYKFLDKPIIELWAAQLKDIINAKYNNFINPKKKFQYQPTIDIDNAWAFKNKGLIRVVGNYLKDLFQLNLKDIVFRSQVLLNLKKDPFDNYEFIINIHQKYNLYPIFFILCGRYGYNDKNINIDNQKYRKLIKHLSDYGKIGIHPSYNSNDNPYFLKKEIKNLSSIVNFNIVESRQHFLKLEFPQTYRNLINNNISSDYTMGYASEVGFRAGISRPFYFFDIDADVETKLRIHPFCIMDSTLKNYKNYNPEEAIENILPVINSVKLVKGNLITVWHNESFGGYAVWKGWETIYENLLNIILS